MFCVLGIDGGGSTTRAAIMNERGRILGLGEAGPSNIHTVALSQVKKNIRLAVKRARRAARTPAAQKFAAAFLGMAGVATENERRIIRKIAAELKLAPKNKIGVDHDIRIAHAGALAGREGIALIAGTGSSCYGRRADGTSARTGGWGPVLDDAGSGYWLGLQAMKAVIRAEDGRAPRNSLRRILFAALKVKTPRDLIALAADPAARPRLASLAPRVIRAANSGDAAAKAIVAEGAAELALLAATVAKKLRFPPGVKIALSGGLACDANYVRAVNRELRRRLPKCEIVEAIHPPVFGAALLAKRFL